MTGGSGINHMECDLRNMPTAWALSPGVVFLFPGLCKLK